MIIIRYCFKGCPVIPELHHLKSILPVIKKSEKTTFPLEFELRDGSWLGANLSVGVKMTMSKSFFNLVRCQKAKGINVVAPIRCNFDSISNIDNRIKLVSFFRCKKVNDLAGVTTAKLSTKNDIANIWHRTWQKGRESSVILNVKF